MNRYPAGETTMSRGEPLIRQWNLLKAMQAVHYGLSADDLSLRLECSKRQVLRDLKILQELGFPVSFEERDFGKRFWRLSAQFIESDKLVFSLTELISIYVGQKLLAPLAGTQFGEGLASLMDKIKAMLSPRALRYFSTLDETLLIKTPILNAYGACDKTIRLLTRAILKYFGVRIRLAGFLGNAPVSIQVDVGFGDAVVPPPGQLSNVPLEKSRKTCYNSFSTRVLLMYCCFG